MKKLISMTDYVLERERNKIEIQSLTAQWSVRVERYNKIVNYANFLKQPLTLGMFIPTDENGNVLEQPLAGMSGYDNIYKRYSEAKDRVIFEGFDFNKSNTDGNYISNININLWTWELKEKTIEDLVKYNLTIKETAVKKYGL